MSSLNKKDFSISADGTDVLVASQSGTTFRNLGNLTTTGDFSNPIRIAADGVTVSNHGNLTTSGNGSAGIVAGDVFGLHYDNVTIVNYGSISTHGGIYFDDVTLAFSDGIDVNGGSNATVVNHGSITTDNFEAGGIGMITDHSTVINYGSIDSLGLGIIFDSADGTETDNRAVNYGAIHIGDVEETVGIFIKTDDSVAINYGTVQVDGFHAFGISFDGSDNSHGENYGTILSTGEQGRGVLFFGEHLTFDNHGTIQTPGADGVGMRFSAEDLPGTDGGTFTNYGKVESAGWAVLGADADDHVVNYGLLAGGVDFGAGDDSYLAGHGSSLAGTLVLGDGNDLVICERGFGELTVADFVTGAGSDDVFDLSAFGFGSLDDVLAHALQDGANVMLNLSGHDQVTLLDTSLASLAADDFLFAASNAMSAAAFHGSDTALAMMHPDATAIA